MLVKKGNVMDNINPMHYREGKVECIDAIESATKNLSGTDSYYVGNIIKYIWRFQHKNGIEDLKKAKWYLDRLIENKESGK
jgi:methyl coenzyme M reductase subunit C-like uncharacterized protein (methanogenesis marker protein 7)